MQYRTRNDQLNQLDGDDARMDIGREELKVFRKGAEDTPSRSPPNRSAASATRPICTSQNFLECVRTRKTPTAPMRLAFQAALVVQMANLSLKPGPPASLERRHRESRSVIVRPMTHADIPDGLRLCRASNWNQLADDWRFFLDRGGAFVAVEDDDRHRQCRVASLRRRLHVALDDAGRSRRAALRHRLAVDGSRARCAAVRLPACASTPLPPASRSYRRFGFDGGVRAGAHHSRRVKPRLAHRTSARSTPDDLPAIFARDRDVFGADRAALLEDFYRRAPDLAWITEGAYCFGRPGHLRPQIGPVVAASVESARALVARCLATHAGQSFVVDIPRRPDGLSFHVERPFLRMCRGNPRDLEARVFAIAGPEFG